MMESLPEAIRWAVAVFALISAFTDLRSREIPNWLTLPAIVAGLGARWYFGGWAMTKPGLIGFGVGFGLYFLFFVFGGRGGGDVKLMGAYGALLGMGNWFVLFVLTAVLGGVIALVVVVAKGRLLSTLRNIRGLGGKDRVTLETKDALSLPHGAVAAAPALLLAWATRPGVIG